GPLVGSASSSPGAVTFSGTFDDSAGNPVTVGSVSLSGSNGDFTDSITSGSFVLSVPAGTYDLDLIDQSPDTGSNTATQEYRSTGVDLSSDLTGVDIQLAAPVDVNVDVTDSSDAPVEGASVEITSPYLLCEASAAPTGMPGTVDLAD